LALVLVSLGAIGFADANHGHLKWTMKLTGIGDLSPAVAPDGTVYVGASLNLTNGQIDERAIRKDEGNLFAMAPTGKLKWMYHSDAGVGSQPIVGRDGTIYFDECGSTADNGMTVETLFGNLDALSPRGIYKWSFGSYNLSPVGIPAFGDDGTLYMRSGSSIAAYTSNGKCLWTADRTGFMDRDGYSQVAVGYRRIFVSNRNYLFSITREGKMTVTSSFLNLVDGPVTPKLSEDYEVSSPVIGKGGTIFLTFSKQLYRNSSDEPSRGSGSLWAFSQNGKYKRLITWNGERSGPLVTRNGRLILYHETGDADGKPSLNAYRSDGSALWSLRLADAITTPVIATDGTIYFGSRDHNLYAVSRTGKIKWKFKTGGDISAPPAVGSDGTVYVASNDHRLYAIR
jgi:outer membrane protein assembly factor BamB